MKNRKAVLAAVMMAVTVTMTSGAVSAEETTEAQTAQESLVASADEMAAPIDVVDEDMDAVYGTDVADGTYNIEVSSSSSMFKIVNCELTVKDGEMSAVMTLSGSGYLKLFMGTGEEAVAASEDAYIAFEENEEGLQTYEVPVEALNKGIDCAAWSKRKEKWYDRVLVFEAASLPQDALKNVEMTLAGDLALEDGVYQVDVTLEGGSGRTQVQSPAKLTVEDGALTAEIVWGSPFYDYMLVGEEKYLPVNTEGDSVFEIPVTGLDYKMPVTADTVAMSTPHEIDYTLYFDSASITAEE